METASLIAWRLSIKDKSPQAHQKAFRKVFQLGAIGQEQVMQRAWDTGERKLGQ